MDGGDSLGLGQRFAIASMERIQFRYNRVTIRWVPAHHGVAANEEAGRLTKEAAEGITPDDDTSDDYRLEKSLVHMSRIATEGRAWAA